MSEEGQGPTYPHTDWINELVRASDERILTEAEITAITEAQMFEHLIEEAIPDLRAMAASIEEGTPAFENAQMYVAVACKFAAGMGRDLASMMEARRIVRVALTGIRGGG